MTARTIGSVLNEVFAAAGAEGVPVSGTSLRDLFRWPPNAFAVTSLLLGDSGAYRRCISPPATEGWPPLPRRQWVDQVREAAGEWQEWALPEEENPNPSPPSAVSKWIDLLVGAETLELVTLGSSSEAWEVCSVLLQLHATADEASEGMGFFIPVAPEINDVQKAIIYVANEELAQRGTLARLSPHFVRVLPKRRTPQTGISLRSLSHHLAIVRGEVEVKWRLVPTKDLEEERRFNLLVLPWPREVVPTDFRALPASESGNALAMDSSLFAFFDFNPPFDLEKELNLLGEVVDRAVRHVGQIDGVAFPECALPAETVATIEETLAKKGVKLFISGVRGPRQNSAYLSTFYDQCWTGHEQTKHHRWCLDDAQITSYGLGPALHPARRWWENIEIHRRALHFVTVSDWLTMCHLVCEDLARQDPVAHAVRSVGPTLVLALLLDGPQLRDRWSARYATVLADDPGSSVLSITSLGMALRSVPPGTTPSRVIALWKDSLSSAREISLAPGAAGVVLNICAKQGALEYSADTRDDKGASTVLVLAGVEQIAGA